VRNMRNSYGHKRKGVDHSQGPPKRKKDVVQIPAVIATPLVPDENAPSSSGWHSNVVLLFNLLMSFLCIVFSLAFPSYMLNFHFSLLFKILFGSVLTIFLDPYNHDSLLSSQSIRRRRSSSDLNSQPAASQPYPLVTRVPECPQSFTSFLVIHFHFAYFPVCLFR
jgi:hypothetical protein